MLTTKPSEHGASPERARAAILTSTVLLAVAAAAWLHVVWMAMHDDMAGMDMAMMPSLAGGLAYTAAWGVMMTAMMLPSALPMMALYAATRRGAGAPGASGLPVALFTAIYLGVWAATGVPMYLASVALSAADDDGRAYATAGMLLLAGVFQLSSLKQACLRRCRSPLGFFLGHWRGGWRGGARIAWAHAAYCLGCCWALMVVLVWAGAMGLVWVLLVSAVVAAEKLLPGGEWIARATGLALLLLGAAVAAQPGLAGALRGGGLSM